jgi:hypothetical protein
MSPREDRRYWIALAITVPVAGVLGAIASVNDWSVGWVWLSWFVLLGLMVLYVHYNPRDRSSRRR